MITLLRHSIYFALLCFLPIALEAKEDKGIAIQVTKDKEIITLEDELTVTIECSYPAIYSFNTFPLMLHLANYEFRDFEVLTYAINNPQTSPTQIVLEIKPRISGELLFTPGIASFSQADGALSEYLVPAIAIECKAPNAKLEIDPLLPLYPESAITISPQNRQKVFEDIAFLENEKLRNNRLSLEHASAWSYLITILLGLGIAALLFWVIFEIEYLRTKIVLPKPKRNFKQELIELSKSSDTLQLRWQKLSLLVREALSEKENKFLTSRTTPELLQKLAESTLLDDREKAFLNSLFRRLEAIEFANEKSSDNEFKSVCDDLLQSSLFTSSKA
jgi:hypothetical protein